MHSIGCTAEDLDEDLLEKALMSASKLGVTGFKGYSQRGFESTSTTVSGATQKKLSRKRCTKKYGNYQERSRKETRQAE